MQQRQENKYDTHFKILLLGNSRVGKSTLLQKFVGEPCDDFYNATLGVDVKEKILPFFNSRIKLRVYDVGGNPGFQFLLKEYLRIAEGAFVCFDITYPFSFENVEDYIKKIRAVKTNIPIFLIGCKGDLTHKRAVSAEQINKLAERLGLTYFETSSHEEVNVKEPFIQIMQQMYFLAALNKVKPILEQHLNDYLKLPSSNNYPGIFISRSTKEEILKDEYKSHFDKLSQARSVAELKDFFRETSHIIERADSLFASENPLLSIVAASPLSKTLKNILSDLHKSTKYFVDLSELANLKLHL
ncbi:TPA: Rab family GTPase [Legionella anisa]